MGLRVVWRQDQDQVGRDERRQCGLGTAGWCALEAKTGGGEPGGGGDGRAGGGDDDRGDAAVVSGASRANSRRGYDIRNSSECGIKGLCRNPSRFRRS